MKTMNSLIFVIAISTAVTLIGTPAFLFTGGGGSDVSDPARIWYRKAAIGGQKIFYGEAGPQAAPTLLLVHGSPKSSHMVRKMIPVLAARYHVVAPDYPGFGNDSLPAADAFGDTFDRSSERIEALVVELDIDRYSLYLMDHGAASVGLRIATAHPDRIDTLIVQNGNAVVEDLGNDFWNNVKAAYEKEAMAQEEALRFLVTLDAIKWQYANGARSAESVNPDGWPLTERLYDPTGNAESKLQLLDDDGSNPAPYPGWQPYLHEFQPPTLLVLGATGEIFPAPGAFTYGRDLSNLELHLLDTGHFALEDDGRRIGELILDFLERQLPPQS